MIQEPIDLEHLTRQTLGDSSLRREVLVLFADHVRLLGGQMAAAGATERRRLAHTIKGAAGGVGAFAVAAAAAKVEQDPQDEALLAPLCALINEACDFATATPDPQLD